MLVWAKRVKEFNADLMWDEFAAQPKIKPRRFMVCKSSAKLRAKSLSNSSRRMRKSTGLESSGYGIASFTTTAASNCRSSGVS